MLVPRDYQEDACEALWDYFHTFDGNPLVLMPTGTGKSVVIGAAVHRMLTAYPFTRVMMATHVETLIAQNLEKLLALWPSAPAGVFSAGLGRKEYRNPITFAGVQSAYSCAEIFGRIDVLFVDEAHLVSPKEAGMYDTLISKLRKINPKLKVVGLTATGWRTDNGPLVGGGMFTDVAIDMTTPEAWNYFVDAGYLSPLYSKRTRFHMDADGVGALRGEYNLKQLQDHVDQEGITRSAIQEMIQWGGDRNCWMVFGTGVNHCEHVADMLNEYGVEAVAIHSKSKNPEKLIAAFRAGEYRAAVSMNKLTTGVDVPQIDLIGCMRHTLSSSLWVQMLGRGTRPVYAPGYDLTTVEGRLAAIASGAKSRGCLVLDFARNTENLGPINNPKIPDKRKKKSNGGGACPVRACPVCLEYCAASARFCFLCGHEFLTKVHMDGTASELEVMVRAGQEEAPVVEELPVQHVTYNVHKKQGKPDSLRVAYFCTAPGGNIPRMFREFICFEHGPGAQRRAHNWWMERMTPGKTEIPTTTQRAKELTDTLRIPQKIRVWTNKKNPEVMSYVYE